MPRQATYVKSARVERDASGKEHRVIVRGRYDIRDQLGHWVAPASSEDRPCPHSCCNSKRVHPDNLPVRLNRSYLRGLTEAELETELGQYQRYADTHEAGFLQIIAEIRRREEHAERKQSYYAREADRQRKRAAEHYDEVYRAWLSAENATKGVMLNRAGVRAGINERDLFTTTSARKVYKYASPELIEWFSIHGRPTRYEARHGKRRYDITTR